MHVHQVRAIEQRMGKPLCDVFDLVCGTSIGGAGAVSVALASEFGEGCDKSEMMLDALVTNVFKKMSLRNYIRRGHRIPDRVRSEFIKGDVCKCLGIDADAQLAPPSDGDGTSGSKIPHVFVVTSQRSLHDGKFHPFLLTNYVRKLAADGGRFRGPWANTWPVKEMIAATTAAPTYFSPVVKGPHIFADGGLIHNNPSLVAISEARAIWPDRPIGTIISLGCGKSVHEHTPNGGWIGSQMLYWGGQIFNLVGDSQTTHRTVLAMLSAVSPTTDYFRLEPITGDTPLDVRARAPLLR